MEKSPYCSAQDKRQILSMIRQGNNTCTSNKDDKKIIDLRKE